MSVQLSALWVQQLYGKRNYEDRSLIVSLENNKWIVFPGLHSFHGSILGTDLLHIDFCVLVLYRAMLRRAR